MSETEIVENGELVPYEHPASLTLFGTSDPRVALERMSDLAKVLVDVVRDRKLAVRIGGREHLTAEAWTTLGGMLGVVPIVVWTHPLEDGTGWEARVEARTLDGRLVGAAESMCSRSESTWAKRDEYALRSMAQTRAIGRALRAPLGQIVVLAGYQAAGAAEIPDASTDGGPKAKPDAPAETARPADDKPTAAQVAELNRLLAELKAARPDVDWPARAKEMAGPGNMLSATAMDVLLDVLLAELPGGVGAAG